MVRRLMVVSLLLAAMFAPSPLLAHDELGYTGTIQSVDAAKHALPNIDAGSAAFINMDHLPPLPADPTLERVAAEIFNPHRIFNGRDLVDYLQTKPAVPPDRVQVNP